MVLYELLFTDKLYEVLFDLVVLGDIFCKVMNDLDENVPVEKFSPKVGVTTFSLILVKL